MSLRPNLIVAVSGPETKPVPRRVRTRCASLALALLAIAATAARAQSPAPEPEQLFTPQVSVTHTWDDNLFRLPDGVVPDAAPGQTSRSDQSTITAVGFKLDKVYSQQRFTIDATLASNNYQTYHYLNFTARNGDAIWAWTATPDVTGHVLFNRAESLNNFADFTAEDQRNIDTNENRRVDVDWRVEGAIHAGAAVYQFVQVNTLPVFELEDVRINSVEPNISYQSAAGNSIGLYGRAAQGTYLSRALDAADELDTNFTEREAGARISYVVDGQTSLFAQLGVLARDHEHFGQRNFHGLVGNLSWTWIFSGKLSSVVTANRSLSNYEQTSSSFVYANRLSVGANYAVSDKIDLTARLQATEYRFGGAIIAHQTLRDDHNRSLVLGAQWQPLRELELAANWSHSNRDSNISGLQFADQMLSLQAIVTF